MSNNESSITKQLPDGTSVDCYVFLYKMDENNKMQFYDAFPTWAEGEIAYDQAVKDNPGVEFDLFS